MRNINPSVSGLVFEIQRGTNHGNEKIAHADFVKDINFVSIANISKEYGFMIDKNAPWRFVANLKSEAMQKRMKLYGMNTLQDMFDSYYYKAIALV